MEKYTFIIPKISCRHCVASIKDELSGIKGVRVVTGDPGKKEITVEWEAPATVERIRMTLKEMNYPSE